MSIHISFSSFPNTFGIYVLQRNHKTGQEELKASVQELAARAAALATAEAAKNITPPTSAYQFEVSWRGFSGDRSLQARLLKVYIIFSLSYFHNTNRCNWTGTVNSFTFFSAGH